MNRTFFQFSLLLAPVLVLGTTSCSSMRDAQSQLADWKEKREERQLAQDVAEAEKAKAEELAATGHVVSAPPEDPIFLDYSHPDGPLGGDSAWASAYGAAPLLPGSDLPVMMDLADSDTLGGPGGEPLFHGDLTPPSGEEPATPPVDIDLVRAWATSFSPLMGASLSEPLITAAMTARPTSTETAVAAHAAATDATPLASAFAGQSVRTTLRPATSELEHE